MAYLWVKAFHIVFMVTWFAGLFYLPRLFVYHAMSDDKTSQERFQVMERKLLYGITTPGAIVTIALGVWLLAMQPAWLSQGWMHAKLALVAILIGYHGYCWVLMRRFAQGENRHSHVWYRWFNEFPVLILVAVVVLAIVKPF
ncbi:TIGR00701 family protein [Alkalilimnicola ehrlichii]|uniref:Protoporphyrinogen IX oxidase n=1 Tax=Alkalilimnicola ehrlichii TaxID=351052 RepID=A0A3E0X335_9GAMM|nr:protoporphyrinogen oxidase HemJ [Alkalilimnicola ehrlichii]RFA31468.1 TIGR00701 family protein [Alkalilimnicola ehrlichii]RFA39260.1 TIGR00701 family protein [Alkalilimnicola ehrlichii]